MKMGSDSDSFGWIWMDGGWTAGRMEERKNESIDDEVDIQHQHIWYLVILTGDMTWLVVPTRVLYPWHN